MTNELLLKYHKAFSVIATDIKKQPLSISSYEYMAHYGGTEKQYNDSKFWSWKPHQTEKIELKKLNILTAKKEFSNIALVCGFEDLEVVDVDTKVLHTTTEIKDFIDEFFTLLKDNILDFESKFVIYRTQNKGYHLLYKCKKIEGNLTLAKTPDNRALLETRGKGGFVICYPNNRISTKNYFDIDYISEEDREILFQISRSFCSKKEVYPEPKKTNKIFKSDDVTPWQDFNDKQTNIFDLISTEFTIPKSGNRKDKILIKRNGATTPHSGYIYKDSNCIYLFSDSTRYPSMRLLTPFSIYAIQSHNGDVKEAVKSLYNDGYGSRLNTKKTPVNISVKDDLQPLDKHPFPLDVFPAEISNYIMECSTKLASDIEIISSAFLWLSAICIGNSYAVEVKKGWQEKAVLWVAVVGRAGVGKTPSINNAIFPLGKKNGKEIKKYIQDLKTYEHYESLDKKEKEQHPEAVEPVKTQFIANDITLEALMELHQESDNAVGVFKDELAGWLKDMNKYRTGSDLEHWLSSWSGTGIFLNRKTAKSSFVDKPFIPVLGGIQPSVLSRLSTEDMKDNGFLDRVLLAYPDGSISDYNENEISQEILDWYEEKILLFFEYFQKKLKRDGEGSIYSNLCYFDKGAKVELKRVFNELTALQNSENENEYLKSIYPKQKTYLPRFCLIIHCLKTFFSSGEVTNFISPDTVLNAEKLVKYFIHSAKKVKFETSETTDINNLMRKSTTKEDKVKDIWTYDKEFNKSKVAELLGISRTLMYKIVKKLEEGENK